MKHQDIVFHNIEFAKNWNEPPFNFTTWDFWLSIGADPELKWTKTYLRSVLSKDVTAHKKGINGISRLTNIIVKKEFEDILSKMTPEEKRGLERYTPKGYENTVIYQYPPHLQKTLEVFINMFDIFLIPDRGDKDYPLWLKELEDLKLAGGKNIRNTLLRAKEEYDNKYEFSIERPRHAVKILKTAKTHLDEEWSNIGVPDEPKKIKKMKRSSLIELE